MPVSGRDKALARPGLFLPLTLVQKGRTRWLAAGRAMEFQNKLFLSVISRMSPPILFLLFVFSPTSRGALPALISVLSMRRPQILWTLFLSSLHFSFLAKRFGLSFFPYHCRFQRQNDEVVV
jgi:hypothetical protein